MTKNRTKAQTFDTLKVGNMIIVQTNVQSEMFTSFMTYVCSFRIFVTVIEVTGVGIPDPWGCQTEKV